MIIIVTGTDLPSEVGVCWLCHCPGIVWEPIRKRSHTQLVRKQSVTVVSARWATVDWSWPKEWIWCARASLHLLKKKLKKAQAGNKLSNILPKSSHARKKPPPPPPLETLSLVAELETLPATGGMPRTLHHNHGLQTSWIYHYFFLLLHVLKAANWGVCCLQSTDTRNLEHWPLLGYRS